MKVRPCSPNKPSHSPNEPSPASPSTLRAPSINGLYGHVVRIDGQWMELSCNMCGANCDGNSQQFFIGVNGFHAHITGPAHELMVDVADVLSHCSKRVVSDRDVGIMLGNGARTTMDCAIIKRMHERNNGSELEQSAAEATSQTPKRQRTVDCDASGLTGLASTNIDPFLLSSSPSRRYSSVDDPNDTSA